MADLTGKVKKWIEKSGYPLEMEVAKNLQTAGFNVVQSEYFEDSESGKWRETDVVAYDEYRSETCRAIFALVAECKGGKDKPWVLFSNKDNYPESLSVQRRASSDKGESILRVLATKPEVKAFPLFTLPERSGYGLEEMKEGGNTGEAFKALHQVLKATLGLVKRLDTVPGENIIPFVWPVIVINAKLFESYLDDKGALQVQEIQRGLLIWKNPIISNHTLVEIYTKDQLIADAKDLKDNAQILLELAAKENDRSPRLDDIPLKTI
jgi:hypothetical protein